VSEALAKAASQLLEIEPAELMAEYRPSLTPEGREGLKAEIFLYDTLPGGAGFSSQLVGCGDELFQRALTLMKTCPENCESSCYRCLRSFKNKFEHRQLDRHVGAELVEDRHPSRFRPAATSEFNDTALQRFAPPGTFRRRIPKRRGVFAYQSRRRGTTDSGGEQ
jgi:ATP-dependent helicase YprA (DUF1998 family)